MFYREAELQDIFASQPIPSRLFIPKSSRPMQHTSPSWLTAEDRTEHHEAFGVYHAPNPASNAPYGAGANRHDVDFAFGTFAEPKPPCGYGARFDCPHCGTVLGVATLPVSGPCPSCGGPLDLPIITSKLWERTAVWLPWLLTLLMIFIIVWGVLLIGNRLGLGALDVYSYNPARDNRFKSWPWSMRANPTCRVPADSITGIGWDARGGSHALVDPSFVVITHNTPPEKLTFRDGDGGIFRRSVVSSHTLSYDAAGLPWVRLCRLDKPLPPTIRPLPVLELSGHLQVDLPLFIVGRHGRIGAERPGALKIHYQPSYTGGRLLSIGAFSSTRKNVEAGDAMLRCGDSGSPLIARTDRGWCLVGLACSVVKSPDPKAPPLAHVHALLSPQLHEMKTAGARPTVSVVNSSLR